MLKQLLQIAMGAISVCIGAGCQGQEAPLHRPELSTEKPHMPPVLCSAYGGISESVCSVSLYRLVANPTNHYGLTVVTKVQVRFVFGHCFLTGPSIGSLPDITSSLDCNSQDDRCELKKLDGKYVTVIGRFVEAPRLESLLQPAAGFDCLVVHSIDPN